MGTTEHQQKVIEEVINNLESSNMALLSGVAGTGKSYCTEQIARHYTSKYKTVAATATTHKAAEVLARSMPTPIKTSTIHSHCNMRMVRNGAETLFVQDTRKEIKKADLLIIDEFSMLQDDVLKVVERLHAAGTKILFVGDASQLIMDSKAIDNISLDSVSSYLLEPIRQSLDSDIALYSKMASQYILGKSSKPDIPYGKEILKYSTHKEFITAWKDSMVEDKIILAYQNKTVSTYNRNIKQKYMFQSEEFAVGNMITLRSSVHTNNGGLLFNKARIKIEGIEMDHDGNSYKIRYNKASNDFFRVPKTKAWFKSITQQYIDAKEWAKYYAIDDFFCEVHHAEAQTTHSSQGDTYEEVFIDGRDLMHMKTMDDLERAIYVAISRAKSIVHIFLGETRNYDHFKRPLEDAL